MMVWVFTYALAFSIVISYCHGDFQGWISLNAQRSQVASVAEDVKSLVNDLALTETSRDEHRQTCSISMQSSTVPSLNADVSQKGFPFFHKSKIQVRNKRGGLNYSEAYDLPMNRNHFAYDVYDLLKTNVNISMPCKIEMQYLLKKLNLISVYAYASGDPARVEVEKGISELGSYMSCFKMMIDGIVPIRGYCLVRLHEPKEKDQDHDERAAGFVKQGIGVCVPSSCTVRDVSISVQGNLHHLSEKKVFSLTCETNEIKAFDSGAKFMFCWLALHIILLCCGTIYGGFRKIEEKIEVYGSYERVSYRRHSGTPHSSVSTATDDEATVNILPGSPKQSSLNIPVWKACLLSFSAKHNFSEFASPHYPDDWIGCLDALKVLGTIIIIFSHTFSYAAKNLYRKPGSFNTDDEHFRFSFMALAIPTVDGFYFISGIVICYATYKRIEAERCKGEFNCCMFLLFWAKFVLRIYFRLIPLLMIIIALSATLLHYGNCGPSYVDSISMYNSRCRKHWSVNLLPPLNFGQGEEMCFPPSWYIAGDMLFAMCACVIVCILYKSHRWGKILLECAGLTCGYVTIVCATGTEFPTETYSYSDQLSGETKKADTHLYMMPYTHVAPYVMGMSIGYSIAKRIIKNEQVTLLCHMLKSPSAPLFCLVCPIYFIYCRIAGSATRPGTIRVYSITSAAFILGLGILAYHCRRRLRIGHRSFWKWFRYPSRLTYAAYLIHPVTMTAFYGCQIADYYSAWTLVCKVLHFTMHLFLTYFLAFIFVVFVECPIRNASKTFIKFSFSPRKYPCPNFRNLFDMLT